jgi:hypothetical protein
MADDKDIKEKEEEFVPTDYKYPRTEDAKSDKPLIVLGLMVFVALMMGATLASRGMGKFRDKPVLELPKHEKYCVRDVAFMRENHMKLLNTWRDQVVRDGVRTEKIPRRDAHGKILKDASGKTVYQTIQRSLTKTCLRCHDNPKNFCQRCHVYAGVVRHGGTLKCFHCHIMPNPKSKAGR